MMLLAQAAAATPPARYEFATLAPWIDQPGAVALGGLLAALLVMAIVWLYWRERVSLSPLRMLSLLLLRLGVMLGVVLYALAPEKRDAREETRPSRVLVVVDDSLSMALAQDELSTPQPSESRTHAAAQMLDEQGLIGVLRQSHEVHVATVSDPRRASVYPFMLDEVAESPEDESPEDESPEDESAALPPLSEWLAAHTIDTRLGDAIAQAESLAAGGPLAGVILFSDGQNNAGANPELAAASLGESGVPVHTVGLGSDTPGANLAVRDLLAPRRAYPKDELRLTAVIEASGFDGADANVSLYVRPVGDDGPAALVESKSAGPLQANEPLSVAFQARPETAGRYEYRVSVDPLMGERDADDNHATAEVQVVDRLLHALLIAGGPTRDYHFLRDQLRRDDAFKVDVWLQSAPAGISQDADNVLTSLPDDEDKLDAYDLFVTFDADWTEVSPQAVHAIERCVSQRGAGLIFVSGPVHTPRWLRDSLAPQVTALLPVKPAAAPLLMTPGARSARQPSRVQLTRAGREAAPLWVLGDPAASVAFWTEDFPGFYSTAEVDLVKPGAVVYAEVEDEGEQARVLFAEQFFGAGRTFYIGAPELWRMRSKSPAAMRAFYTKLLQHVSQGRLLADSAAGSLVFERDRYNVGDTLTLRATLTDKAASELSGEEITAQIDLPGDRLANLKLRRNQGSDDTWSASLRADSEGPVAASLSLPGVPAPLTAKAVVRVPALERSRTERDAVALRQIAEQSGGHYYATEAAVLEGADDLLPLAEAIPSRTEKTMVYGAPDDAFARRVSRWLLGLIAGCLLAEWSLRRVMNLA